MATIGGKSLGNVKSESNQKSGGLFNQPIPYEDSDAALISDFLGTSRTITIIGNKTGTVAELRTFVTDIEAIMNGAQTGSTFVSSWTNVNKTVLIQDFNHEKAEGDENKVNYTITLLEGSPF